MLGLNSFQFAGDFGMYEVNKDKKENPVTWVSKSNVRGSNGSDKVIDQHQADDLQAGVSRQQMERPSLKFQTHHWPARPTVLSSSESWTSPLRGVPPCVLVCSKVNYYLMADQSWQQQVEKNWQKLRGWMKHCILTWEAGSRERGGWQQDCQEGREKHPQRNLKDAQSKLPWFPNLAQDWGPATFLSFIIN